MIYPMVLFPVTLSDPWPRFQGHGVIRPIDALDVLCAQLMSDLFAIAEFLLKSVKNWQSFRHECGLLLF